MKRHGIIKTVLKRSWSGNACRTRLAYQSASSCDGFQAGVLLKRLTCSLGDSDFSPARMPHSHMRLV